MSGKHERLRQEVINSVLEPLRAALKGDELLFKEVFEQVDTEAELGLVHNQITRLILILESLSVRESTADLDYAFQRAVEP